MPADNEPIWSTRFLSALVHELRTPLASLLLTAELLADDPRLEPRQARYARTVGEAAADLRALLDDVGELNRLHAGRVTSTPAEVAVEDALAAAVVPFRRITTAEGVSVAIDVAPGTPARLRTDPAQLQRILQAMVGAALRSGAHRIELKAVPAGAEVAISVRDDGTALSAEELPRLFEPFTAAGGRTRRPHGGSSLGLAVAAALASLLGGGLVATSDPSRTTLRLTLPVGA